MIEQTIVQFLAGARTPLLNEIMLPATFFGSIVFALVFAAAMRTFDSRLSAKLATGSILAYLSSHLIKIAVKRPRPAVETLVEVSTYSFPSAHTAVAFALAAALDTETGSKRFYLLAAATGFSRMYLGAHYLSDVVAGAFIGYVLGKYAGVVLAKVKNFTLQLR